MMGRALRLCLVMATVLFVAAPAGAAEEIVVESVDLGNLPEVSMIVTLPPSMAGSRPSAEDFAVLIEGGRPRLGVFAAVSAPLEVVLLLDTSGSMSGEPIVQAREAAAGFVDALPGNASITVVAFGESVRTIAGPTDDAEEAIMGLSASGETALYDAVIAGVGEFEPEGTTRRVMIILSDGGDTISGATLEEAVAAAGTSNAELHAVALATSESDNRALAEITGGSVLAAGAAADLSDRYAEIAVTLTGRYRLTFSTHAAGPTEIAILVNGSAGIATATVVVEFPEVGAPAASGSTSIKSTPMSIDAGPPVTISGPGTLGRPWVLPAGVALVFLGSVITLWLTLRQRDDQPPAVEMPQPEKESSGPIASLAARLRSLGDQYAERSASSSIDASLDRAGIKLRPGEFVVVAATGIVVLTLVGVTVGGLPGAIIFGGAAALAPRTVLRTLTERRRRRFSDQLEGTLQIIAGSLRAGYGLTQAIVTVAEESPIPTSQEFNRVVVENRLGRSVEQSMAAMATRMDNEDLGWVVEAIQIQHEVGGNLAEVLDTVNGTIRDRNQIRRQVKALSAEGRISAFILLALPFVIGGFIAMISPDYLSELTGTPVGRIMLGVAALLMAAGAGWIKRIVRVEF